jgi:hypothetical protein
MWSEKCDSDLFFAEIVWNDSFSWSCLIISSSVFFHRLASLLTNDACSFLILEWRMFVLDLSSDVYNETSLMRHLIKLDESDSSNLMSENVISSNDESDSSNLMSENVIWSNDESDLSNLTKATSSHQVESARHLIKLFEKTDNSSTFWWAIFCSDTWYEKLNLAENRLLSEDKCLCKTAMISERSWWKLNVDITQLFLKRKASTYVKTIDNCGTDD